MTDAKKDDLVAKLEAPPIEEPADVTPTESESHDPVKGSNYVRFAMKAWTHEDFRQFIREGGQDPDEVTFTYGWTSNPSGGFWNKLNNVRPIDGSAADIPKWPVIDQAKPVVIKPTTIKKVPKLGGWKTAIVGSDTQFGYRAVLDASYEEFHDEDAISVFHQIVRAENPDQTIIAGDILDLSQQGKFVQEAGFARTTQLAIDRTTTFAAQLRADTDGKLVFIEGNHDKRMQNFVEANAVSALGLKKGNWPDSYPVMSIPYLLRLDEFDIEYKDAYPTAHHWINERLRVEHGDRSNNNGSTAERYARETPHISRVFGHSHRLEVMPRVTYDRTGRISSKFVNTGCLCRIDGTVPGFHAATGINGRSAQTFENWQHGLAVFRYRDEGEFFVNLVAIEDGVTVYEGQEFRAR